MDGLLSPINQQMTSRKRPSSTDTADYSVSKRRKASHRPSDAERISETSFDHWSEIGLWPEQSYEMETNEGIPRVNLLARRNLSRKRSVGGSSRYSSSEATTPEARSVEYHNKNYSNLMADKNCYMQPDLQGPIGLCSDDFSLIEDLLKGSPQLPPYSNFDECVFESTCLDMADANEAMVRRDIGDLIFPSPRHLFNRHQVGVCGLTDMLDEKWVQAIPVMSSKPQPDITVGFKRRAFTDEQLKKLRPYLGETGTEPSQFAATFSLLFPVATSEAKRSGGDCRLAQNQNANSMFTAIRGVVYLYQLAGLDLETLNGKLLGFSVSHNENQVQIHGYYPVIGEAITYHRHEIKNFLLQEDKGIKRWMSYKFFANVYSRWAPGHLDRLCSAIDTLSPAGEMANKQSMDVSQGMAATYTSIGTEELEHDELSNPVLEGSTLQTSFSASPGAQDELSSSKTMEKLKSQKQRKGRG